MDIEQPNTLLYLRSVKVRFGSEADIAGRLQPGNPIVEVGKSIFLTTLPPPYRQDRAADRRGRIPGNCAFDECKGFQAALLIVAKISIRIASACARRY